MLVSFIKKNYIYFIAFIILFVFISYFGFTNNSFDPINNYGFSYAIVKGEIPYRDFNLISTPLFAFFSAIGLFLYNDFITFLLEQTILVTICFYFLHKLYGNKCILFLALTVFTQYRNIVPTYNFCCFFMMVIIIYLEKNYSKKDILIGFFIGLAILSKQTVGCFFIIPSLIFYFKDIKKLSRRLLGCLIPCLIFLIYLLFNKALLPFIDLCIFGLFDFFTNNGVIGNSAPLLWLSLSFFVFVISIFLLVKNKKDISYYYLIFGIFFVVPLFDIYHFSMYLDCFLIMLFPLIKLKKGLLNSLCLAVSIPTSICTFFAYTSTGLGLCITKDIPHFKYNLRSCYDYKNIKNYNRILDSFGNYFIYIGYYSMMYSIISDHNISYFDVPLYGNHGYRGTDKMINKIKDMSNRKFIVHMGDYNSNEVGGQFNKEIARYVIKNYKKVDSKYDYIVYSKE